MKDILRKTTAILILMMILLNSSLLLVISSAVDVTQEVIDESKVNVLHEINLEKYVNYAVDGDKVTLVQINLKTGVEFTEEQNYFPIEKTDIALNLPKIEGEYPNKVELVGISTKATNGNEEAKDIKNVYNSKTGELRIETTNSTNEEESKDFEQVNGARDEYKIILYYSSQSFTARNITRQLEVKGTVQASFTKEKSKAVEINEIYNVTENISGLISIDVTTNDIYNGAIKANKENGASQRTEYVENVTINPSYKNLSDEVQINLKNTFIDENNIETEASGIIYKSTKIDKNKVLEQLGEDGYLQILNENQDVLLEINKDTEAEENGIVEINYEEEISNIIIKTSQIKELKGITIQNEREIKETVADTDINKIQTKGEISCSNNEKEVYHFNSSSITEIKEAETRIDLSVDKTELTNNAQNDVVFTADLITDNIKFNLFKNPVLEIKLPTEVEKIILGEVSLLYDDNLRISNAEVVDRDGAKVIRIEVKGTQNNYMLNSMITGAHIVIPATIMVKNDIESVQTKIKWSYSNEITGINDYIVSGAEDKEIDLTIYSVINNYIQSQSISNYNMESSDENVSSQIKAILGDHELKEGENVHEKEYIRYIVSLKNNTRNKIEGIKINGSVPQGTTFVETTLGEYSFTEKDKFVLNEISNKSDYEEIISLEAGEEKNVEYWVRANSLQEGENSKEISNSIRVSKDGNTINEYNIKNNIIKSEMELKLRQRETGRAPNVWIYDIYAKNTTDHNLNNVVLNINLPSYVKYSFIEVKEDYKVEETVNGIRVTVPSIKTGEERHVELFMQVSGFGDGKTEYLLDTIVSGNINNGNDIYYSNLNKENIYGAGIKVIQTSEKEGKELQYDEEVEYHFDIEDITPGQSTSLGLSLEIYNYADKNLIPVRAEYEYYEYDDEKQDYVLKKGTKDLSKAFIEDGDLNLYLALGAVRNKNISVKLFFKAGEVYELTETSNNMTIKYEYAGETYTVVSNIIKNKILPREFDLEEEDPNDPTDPSDPEIPDAPDDPNDPYDPKPDDPNNPDNPDNPDDPNNPDVKYTINGFAWEDTNKDGKYNQNENKLRDITVRLFDASSNNIVVDGNGNKCEVKTDNNGAYSFGNITKGKYLVIFEYDNGKYGLTTYKKPGVDENNNSDVVEKNVSIDGIEKTVAVTEIINIENNNGYNFNIGLVQNEDFRISLDKSITNVTLNYGNKSKEYNYNESKLAKVEVPAKQVSNASISVQYQLKITNNGNVDAYIDEIVDYLPEGFNFNSELNDGWSKSSNGTLKNTSLSGVIIKAGSSKVVNLCLTKKLSSGSMGTVTNKASILKGTSVNGNVLSDKNSSESNYSEAKLLISVKTGALLYTSIILITIIVLIVIKILIDKKIINIKFLGCLIVILSAICTVSTNNNSTAGGKEDAVIDPEYSTAEAKTYVAGHHTSDKGPTNLYYTTVSDTSPDGGDWTTGPFDEGLRNENGDIIYSYHHHTAVNYVHHGLTHGPGQLYCSDGKKMAEGAPGWTYTYQNIQNLSGITIEEKSRRDVATVNNNGSDPEFVKLAPTSGNNSEYFLVGPYNVRYNGKITRFVINSRNIENGRQTPLSISEYKIVDINGNEFSVNGQIYNVPNGQDFYIKVKKDISWIGDMNIRVEKEGYIKYKISYSGTEIWKWQNQTNEDQIIIREKPYENIITDEIPRHTYNELTIKGVRVPLGHLNIQKADKDTGEAIKGFKIKLENADYYYYKEIEDGGAGDDDGVVNGKILVKNLPVKYGKPGANVEKIEYTITEIVAPSGYDLELQAESDVIQVKTLTGATKNETGGYITNTKVVTKNNKQYGDLSVVKVDQTTFDKMNGVGFLICKDVSNSRYYISSYQYKQNEPAIVTWSTDIVEAMCFYTGIQGQVSNGYIIGNCTAEDGRILLKNLPVKDGTSEDVVYNAVEYRFDYDKNPDLIYYKLDKTKTESVTLITNAYNKTSSDSHQVKLTRYAITEFYTSNYMKKMLKEANAENIVSGIYQAITGQVPNASFMNTNANILNTSKTKEGYDQATIKYIIDSIYNDTNNASIILVRAKSILNDENSIVSFRDYLFSIVGIQNEDIKDSMKDFAYYALKSQTMAIMENKQYTIDISGLVWEDIASSNDKLTWTGNSLFHNDERDTEDEIVTGITVELYAEPNQQGTRPTLIAETKEDGYKFKGSDFVLDANGNRVLDEEGDPKIQYNIVIDNLSSYWIEFEYNGLRYQNVLTEKELRDPNNSNYKYSIENNTSKAKEKLQERSSFNESFSEISGNSSSTVSQQDENNDTYREIGETAGNSENSNGQYTNELKYVSIAEKTSDGEHIQKSTFFSETEKEYSVSSMEGKIFDSNGTPRGVAIRAYTGIGEDTAECNFMDMYERLPEGAREIPSINLGIFEREQPDMAVASDLNNIQLSINGYSHTYNYKQRFTDDTGTVNPGIINSAYDTLMNGFSVAVKRNGTYKELEYEREIYDSYIAYTKQDPTNENKLKMYINYTILVKNESSSLVSQVRLRNYADSRLNLVSAKFEDGTKAGDWGNEPIGTIGDNMSVWETKDLIDRNIPAGESIKLNLIYEVSTSAIVQMAEPDYAEKGLEIYANLTEIASYSTWDQSGKRYAGIDKDSAPNNIGYGNTSTYEDDTDAAPRFKIKRKPDDEANKKISGTVFEDSINGDYKRNNLMTGEERKGNGQYDDGENTVENVKVELLTYNEDNPVKLYTLNGVDVEIKEAVDLTKDNGSYSFVGLVPGEYYLKYTYGKFDGKETTIVVDKTDRTKDIKVTTENYKSTIVDSGRFKTLLEDINNIDASKDKINRETIANEKLYYWYDHINNLGDSKVSSAVDDVRKRKMVNDSLSTINYETETAYQVGNANSEIYYMNAYSGLMDFAIEDEKNQETQYNEAGYINGKRDYEVKFGIIERPRQSLQVTKEISKMSLKLANGHVLAQGDPRNDTINYVTYPDGNRLKIEIDSELIQGSNLELEYEIKVYNRSENDYNTSNYYRYGEIAGGEKPIDISYVIADYADENLTFNNYTVSTNVEDYNGGGMAGKNKWQLLGKDWSLAATGKKLAEISIWDEVFDSIKTRNNILIANSNISDKISIRPGEESTLTLVGKKLLSSMTDKDTVFNNHIELIQITNPIGRFYGNTYTAETVHRKSIDSKETNVNKIWEATKTGEWKIETPGNYNLTKVGEVDLKNEGDNNAYIRAQSTIVPPLGESNIAIYIAVGVGSLLILAAGVILIIKKVLK